MNYDWHKHGILGSDQPQETLLAAARADMNRRSAHEITRHDPPFEFFRWRVDDPVPQPAIHYLQLIMTHTHQWAFPEWLRVVKACGYQPQLEVLQGLIYLYDKLNKLIPLSWIPEVWHFLGTDGLDMARIVLQGQKLTNLQTTLLSLTQPSVNKMIQDRQKLMLRAHRSVEHRFLMRRITWPWTPALTERYLEQVLSAELPSTLLHGMDRYAYFLPLNFTATYFDDLLARLDNPNLSEADHTEIKTMQTVFAFRHRMIATIQGVTS